MSASDASRELAQQYRVPVGVTLRVGPGEVLAYAEGYEMEVRGVATHSDDLETSDRTGRKPLGVILTRDGRRILVREYRKGGLLRWLRGSTWFLGRRLRPLAEFALLRQLMGAAVPVVEAVGCAVTRRILWWRGRILTVEVSGGVDLEAWLVGPAPGEPARATLLEAGHAVRLMHDAGVFHADLHPKNLLRVADGQVVLLDFDRAVAHEGPLPEGQRLKNLTRLARAVAKLRLRGATISPRSELRFLEGYAGSREAGAEWAARIAPRLQRALALRVPWWKLVGLAPLEATSPTASAGGSA